MNLRNWSRFHSLGVFIGCIGPIIYIPLTVLILSYAHNYPFKVYWNLFFSLNSVTGKFVSLSILPNLLWFYILLNKEKYETAMGIIIGSALYIPYIVYINFF